MSSNFIYYVYAYLRSKDSKTAKAGTPYYIGKGKGDRAYDRHVCPVPKDHSLIIFLETNLSDIGALALERRLISWYGRIDLRTGILRNLTDGGEGSSGLSPEIRRKMSAKQKGRIVTAETRQKMSDAKKGRKFTDEHRHNMSASAKKKPPRPAITEETRRKMSAACSNEDFRQRMSAIHKGKTVTADTRKKMSDAKKAYYQNLTIEERVRLSEMRSKAAKCPRKKLTE